MLRVSQGSLLVESGATFLRGELEHGELVETVQKWNK